MANLCLAALTAVRDYLLDGSGINATLAEIAGRDGTFLEPLSKENTLIQNVSARIADENEPTAYPAVYLYCSRIDNELLEKFRRFSGRIWLVADVRVSQERFLNLESQPARYGEAVTTVLGKHQGKWTENLAYNGAHRVQFHSVEHGGQNFIQRAEIEVELQAHD